MFVGRARTIVWEDIHTGRRGIAFEHSSASRLGKEQKQAMASAGCVAQVVGAQHIIEALPTTCRALKVHSQKQLSVCKGLSSSPLCLRQTWQKRLPRFAAVKELDSQRNLCVIKAEAYSGGVQQYGTSSQYTPEEDPEEANKRVMVSKRLESTARYFRRLGALGFWSQLVCSIVAAVILAFSVVVSGTATAPVTTYLTCAGIAAAFLSTFWSYGYMRLANRLQSVLNNPSKAPPRASVIDNLKSGLIINLLGAGAALLGLQATVGVLVGKALTSSYTPFSPGAPPGYSPVLALDVFLIQASGNTLLSHFLGLGFTLELLRALTLQQPPPDNVIPKPA